MRLLKEYIAKLIKENLESPILNDNYFMRRIPFFERFENNSYGDNVVFDYYKNWQDENAAVLHFGKGKGFVKFLFLSVEIKFDYYPIRKRDFDSNEPKFITEHQFNYSTDIKIDFPNSTSPEDKIAILMATNIMKQDMKLSTSFTSKDGEEFPKEELNKVINNIAKNLYNIDLALSKMGVNF